MEVRTVQEQQLSAVGSLLRRLKVIPDGEREDTRAAREKHETEREKFLEERRRAEEEKCRAEEEARRLLMHRSDESLSLSEFMSIVDRRSPVDSGGGDGDDKG